MRRRHPDPGRSIGQERLPIPAGWPGMVWAHLPPWRPHPRHRHDEVEANLVMRGEAVCLVGDRPQRLQRGDLLWLDPAVEHVVAEESHDFAMWVLVWRRAPAWPLGPRGIPPAICRRHIDSGAAGLAAQTCAWLSNQANAELARSGMPWLLALCWSAFAAVGGGESSHPAVDTALRLLEGDGAGLSGSELARRCGLSQDRLGRLFRAQVGMPLVRWRNRCRLERAQRMMDDGQPLSVVARVAGFGSYTQFHRSFRLAFGLSPRDQRRGAEHSALT